MRFYDLCCVTHILRRRLCCMRISEIHENRLIDHETKIKGWIRAIRVMKNCIFFDVADGTTFQLLQVVAHHDDVSKQLCHGSSVEVSGTLAETKSGQIELRSKSIKIIGPCDVTKGYPFLPRVKYNPQELRDHLHFRPRTLTFSSMMRVRDRASRCIHQFFEKEKFISIHTPIITSNDCEGAGEIFCALPESQNTINEMRKNNKTDAEAFFDTKAFMTVSGQLHLEAMARALSKVYQFGPVFRAENSKSRLHLSEFYMVEAEVAFLSNIQDLLRLIENLIKYIIRNILDTHEKEISNYRKLLSLSDLNFADILEKPYAVMTFKEACTLLEQHTNLVCRNKHLSKENELFLVEHNNNIPLFVVDWPPKTKPFYVKTDPSELEAAAVDLLFPGVGELCGGSLREDDYDLLKKKLTMSDLLTKLSWYLDLRKFGNVPTGGFGMGFERFLKVLMGTASIKDTIPFPRWPHNCRF